MDLPTAFKKSFPALHLQQPLQRHVEYGNEYIFVDEL